MNKKACPKGKEIISRLMKSRHKANTKKKWETETNW